MSKATSHSWRFFYAGGFEQVHIDTPEDLAELRQLDQKLWATLACPTYGLEVDQRLLEYIDTDKDGRIRAPDILAAIDWTLARLADPKLLFAEKGLQLSAFKDNPKGKKLSVTALRLLNILGRDHKKQLTAADTNNLGLLFPPQLPNGDGLVPATLTHDAELKTAITDIITCLGPETDRSGEPAVSKEKIDTFFLQAQALYDWHSQQIDVEPFGEDTPAVAALVASLRDKIDDYFSRVKLVVFDPRAAASVNGEEEELARLTALSLADTEVLSCLPLAKISDNLVLPLDRGINPAWYPAIKQLREQVIAPLLGDVQSITEAQWRALVAQLSGYFAWQDNKPDAAILANLGLPRITELVTQGAQERLLALVAEDEAVEQAANGLLDLDKLLRCQEGLIELLKNFISFEYFYNRKKRAIFQAGTLYIDGKSCDLVVEVKDVEAHSVVAANSNNYLLYCRCTRRDKTLNDREEMNIVVAVTAGTEGGLVVGRNGLFYDRHGDDWDATVVKVVASPISIREAFWSPYRRIAMQISEQIQKLAADRDSEVVSKAALTVEADSTGDNKAKAFDIAKFAGVFAAIGLAMAALGTALAAVMKSLRALEWWQWPLVVLGIVLLVSGPSMLLAWFKLRRRNLGPILDANGWAVNTRAKISLLFGRELTQLAALPQGAKRTLNDYAAGSRYLRPLLWVLLFVVLGAALYWYQLLR